MGVEASLQPAEPPEHLSHREAWVQLNKLNTIVIPHDPEDHQARRWACIENYPPDLKVPIQRGGNEVVYLIDGRETLPQFQCEIEKTGGPGDFIYLLGWFLDIDLVFPDAGFIAGRSMRDLLTEKAKAGVKIRVMLDAQWHEGNSKNEAAIQFLESLSQHGAKYVPALSQSWRSDSVAGGVFDDHFALDGSHHQKTLIVKAGNQLTAFCGGVDINPDRVHQVGDGTPQHDVHCRIRGPAAGDVLKIFCDRWNDFMTQYGYPAAEKTIGQGIPAPNPCGDFHVQICRTFGHITTAPHQFAPQGEQSIRKLIERAIEASQRFIYIEDQYLTELGVAKLIGKHLPNIKHVTILIPPPHFNQAMGPDRLRFIDTLRERAAEKVRVYFPSFSIDGCGTYVHAKTWIFDDKLAIIGSANCNYRGLTHDSEVSAGIYDASNDSTLTYTFAHRLRIKLWAHHLGMDTDEGHAELADGVASADHWWGGPNCRVSRFWDAPGRVPRAESAAGGTLIDPKEPGDN